MLLNIDFAEKFIELLKQRIGRLQIGTAMKVLERTAKTTTYREFGIQAGQEEIDTAFADLLQEE